MKQVIRQSIAVMAIALLAFPAYAGGLAKPRAFAVYFFSQNCPNCRVLSPTLEKAREQGALDSKEVLFVTLDLTDAARIHQSMLLAAALGIDGYVQKQGSATGYVALLAADGKSEVKRFDRTHGSGDIARGIDDYLAQNL